MLDTLSNRLQNVKLRIKRAGTCLRISGLYRKQISTTTLDSSDTTIIPTTNTEEMISAASMVLPLKYPYFCSVHPRVLMRTVIMSCSDHTFSRVLSTGSKMSSVKAASPPTASTIRSQKSHRESYHLITRRACGNPFHRKGVTAGGLFSWNAAVVLRRRCHTTGLTAQGFLAAQLRIDMTGSADRKTRKVLQVLGLSRLLIPWYLPGCKARWWIPVQK